MFRSLEETDPRPRNVAISISIERRLLNELPSPDPVTRLGVVTLLHLLLLQFIERQPVTAPLLSPSSFLAGDKKSTRSAHLSLPSPL